MDHRRRRCSPEDVAVNGPDVLVTTAARANTRAPAVAPLRPRPLALLSTVNGKPTILRAPFNAPSSTPRTAPTAAPAGVVDDPFRRTLFRQTIGMPK